MAESRESNAGSTTGFHPAELTQLAKAGMLVRNAASTLEEAPGRLEFRQQTWRSSRLDFKAVVLENETLSAIQKAAWLTAVNKTEPGSRYSDIQKRATELTAHYAMIDELLSQPGVLVLQYQSSGGDYGDESLFRTAGTSLQLGVADREEGYAHGLYATKLSAEGTESLVFLKDSDSTHPITDPGEAYGLPDLSFKTGLWLPKLMVGAEAIAAWQTRLAERSIGESMFPQWLWEEARSLGVKFEDMHPVLRERFDNVRRNNIDRLVRNLWFRSGEMSEYNIADLKKKYQRDADFFGISRSDIETGLIDLNAEKLTQVLGLLGKVTSVGSVETA